MDNQQINQSPTNEEVKRIGRLLKSIRIAKGLNQDDIAAQGEVKRSTIIAIEYGKYNAGIKQVSAYANALGYEVTFQPKTLSPDRQSFGQ